MIKERKAKKLNILFAVLIGIAAVGIAALAVVARMERAAPAAEVGNGNIYHDEKKGSVPLVVDFEPLETTAEEYERLYGACCDYVNGQENYAAASNEVINVTEDTFIDSEETPAPNEETEPDEYVEYDRAYFKDFLMIRYVSQNGAIQVIGTRLNRSEEAECQIELIDQMDFNAGHFAEEEVQEEGGWSLWPTSEEEEEENGSVSENAFVTCLGECVVGMLTDSADAEKFSSHFTAEGAAALLRIIQVLGIDSDYSIGVTLGAAGTSDLENGTKDRVYLRCELLDGYDSTYLNILIKLNSDLMVFDVDII